MVEEQIVARGIHDEAVLAALRKVPRHRFVPDEAQTEAYADSPLCIGYGQTISQPYIVAFMTSAARVTRNTKVLEIGTGSGYQAAIAAELSDRVYTIENIPELAEQAAATLRATGYDRVHTRVGDGYHGWPEEAPFDAILVTAAAETIPRALLAQLADGGRMIIPVGPPGGPQNLLRLTRQHGSTHTETLLPVAFVPFTRGVR